MKDTETDFKVVKRIMTGELVRFDIIVLARFCDYLNCSLTDIIEYFPNKN
jgi:DNA-binding Xre family transcriptional regulator